MAWTLTPDLTEFSAGARGFLRSEPVENTVLLTVTESLAARGLAVYGDEPPLFGWWAAPDGRPGGAFLHTPPFGVALSGRMPPQAAAELAVVLAARGWHVGDINGEPEAAFAFADAWREQTGMGSRLLRRMRLHRLAGLRMPDPAPPGAPRVASQADRDLLIRWMAEFHREVNEEGATRELARAADDRLSYGGMTLWEVDGRPVSLAGLTRPAAGQVRVGPVYTPPEHRRRGFAGAATAAATRSALDAGAREVLLYTDVANPTSNALYQRLGYQPVSDRVALSLESGGAATD